MSAKKLQVQGVASNAAAPSPKIWADCPWNAIGEDPGVGYRFEDDFVMVPKMPTITTEIGVWNGYNLFGSSGATALSDAVAGSGLALTEATDDESIAIGSYGKPFRIATTAGKLWFEARIKISTIATTTAAFFVGLADNTALSVAVPLTATAGAIADLNLVGFHKLDTDLGTFSSSYKTDGNAAVAANSLTGTIVAATYIKLGMKFDPFDNKIRWYVDGVQMANTYLVTTTAGNPFPNDVGLGPTAAVHLGAAAAGTLTIDWWRGAQLRV